MFFCDFQALDDELFFSQKHLHLKHVILAFLVFHPTNGE